MELLFPFTYTVISAIPGEVIQLELWWDGYYKNEVFREFWLLEVLENPTSNKYEISIASLITLSTRKICKFILCKPSALDEQKYHRISFDFSDGLDGIQSAVFFRRTEIEPSLTFERKEDHKKTFTLMSPQKECPTTKRVPPNLSCTSSTLTRTRSKGNLTK